MSKKINKLNCSSFYPGFNRKIAISGVKVVPYQSRVVCNMIVSSLVSSLPFLCCRCTTATRNWSPVPVCPGRSGWFTWQCYLYREKWLVRYRYFLTNWTRNYLSVPSIMITNCRQTQNRLF